MSEQIVRIAKGSVAVLLLNRASGNALVQSLREDLAQELDRIRDDDGTTAVVLTGAGDVFSTGYNLTELSAVSKGLALRDLANLIELFPKPVVCALNGLAQGAGLELALAAHARVASQDATVSLPDIRLHLPTGGGATQRLPRLLAAGPALRLMLTGEPFRADAHDLKGLFSELVEGDPVGAAVLLAKNMAKSGEWRRTRDLSPGLTEPEAYHDALARAARSPEAAASPAADDLLTCFEAAQMLPFEQGILFEQERFAQALDQPRSKAARHLAIADHRSYAPPLNTAAGAPAKHVALIGRNALVGELAANCLRSGLRTTVITADPAAARLVRGRLETFCSRLSASKASWMLEGLQVTTKEADLSDADLILDSGQFAIDDVGALSETAVWISLVPGDKPDFLPPERFAQVHVGRPAHIRQIVELTLGAGTGDTELARVLSGFVSMGCRVIRTPLAPGMLESRLSAVLGIVGTTLMARGVPPELIDQAASKEGFRIGPCAHMDSVGLAEVSRRVERWFPKHTAVVERLRKIGDALEGTSLLDPEAASDVPEYLVMDEESVAASSFPKEQIGASVLAAVVSEAAALVGAGAVTLASDLDILMIRGFAYNADLGGPLFHADQVGVFSLYRTLEELQGFGRIWTPSADLRTMILNGDGFYGRLTFAQPTASVL